VGATRERPNPYSFNRSRDSFRKKGEKKTAGAFETLSKRRAGLSGQGSTRG